MLEKLFHLTERKSTIRTEIIAGLVTFFAMSYILGVAPSILGDPATGLSAISVFFATAIASCLACLVMGLFANFPVALAPGMGVTSIFTYSIVLIYGYTGAEALAAVFIAGVLFFILSVTGIRQMIIDAIPLTLKLAIGTGTGFFISMIALSNSGIIVAGSGSIIQLGTLSDPVVALAAFGILVTLVLMSRKTLGAPFIGMAVTAIIGLIMGAFGMAGMPTLPASIFTTSVDFSTFGAFVGGLDGLIHRPEWIIIVITLLFVDFFDTTGTLIALGSSANFMDEEGNLKGMGRALVVDSGSTIFGAILGTSSITTYVESGTGIAAGGRTGITALVAAAGFFLSLFLAPLIVSIAVACVTAPAIFAVGVYMSQQMKKIDWSDIATAAVCFITIVVMVASFSISNGIAVGFITYSAIYLFTGRAKELSPLSIILTLLFVVYLMTL